MVSVVVPNHQQAASALSSQQPLYPNRKIALVTGSNKGIGYEIAKKLLSHDDGDAFVCILGCRNEALGRASADKLVSETKNSCADVVKIDLMDHDSITKAAEYIQATYGRCDVLINNAAVCYNDPTLYGAVSHTPFAQQAETTIATNFFGTLALTRAMLPLLHQSGADNSNTSTPRIINIASSAGRLSIIPSNEKKAALSSESLTFGDLESLMKDFVQAAKKGKHSSEGWPNTGYGVSKVGIIAMTKILAQQHCGKESNSDSDSTTTSVRRLMVNSVDPGYCATDQNNNQGVIPAERGAVTPYLLATLNDNGDSDSDSNNGFTGKHWYQEREIEW